MEDLVSKAKNYAMVKHMGQTRDDGSPYVFHPLRVSQYLAIAAPKDENLIAAGALHDVIEDCGVSYETLKEDFNEDIANLVREVSKEKPDPTKASYFPYLKTDRGKIIKFFDRADNLSDMKGFTDEKRNWYFNTSKFWRETIDDPIHMLRKPFWEKKFKNLILKIQANKTPHIQANCRGFECTVCAKCSLHGIHIGHAPIDKIKGQITVEEAIKETKEQVKSANYVKKQFGDVMKKMSKE